MASQMNGLFPLHSKDLFRAQFLGDKGGGGGRLVLEVWWDDTLLSVVSSKSVDSRFDKNQSEFTVLVLKSLFSILFFST
jgi:hypothetical protein